MLIRYCLGVSDGFDFMKRLMVSLVLIGVGFFLVGIDPAFARAHSYEPSSGWSLWQIAMGVICLLAFVGGMTSGPKIDRKKQKQENEEIIKKEKSKKGLFRYYGEGIGTMLLYWSAPFILVGLVWSCDQIFK
jgi:hypothetical protein